MNRTAITIAAARPVVWSALGYQFEAASMLAGLSACLTVRLWVSLTNVPARPLAWVIDAVVTMIAMLFTAGWIVLQRPEPFYALLGGTGFGALGAGIITIALQWVKQMASLSGSDDKMHTDLPRQPP